MDKLQQVEKIYKKIAEKDKRLAGDFQRVSFETIFETIKVEY